MAAFLKTALSNPDLRDTELAKPFGYSAPFAEKTRNWLHKTGIAELGFPVRLTAEGKKVWQKDPNLELEQMQWFIHLELTKDPNRAEAWHFFIYEFLLNGLMMKLRSHSEKHFGPGSKLNIVIVRKLLECYTEDYALGSLRVLTKQRDRLTRGKDLYGVSQ